MVISQHGSNFATVQAAASDAIPPPRTATFLRDDRVFIFISDGKRR
jgi:hypothetical protein